MPLQFVSHAAAFGSSTSTTDDNYVPLFTIVRKRKLSQLKNKIYLKLKLISN